MWARLLGIAPTVWKALTASRKADLKQMHKIATKQAGKKPGGGTLRSAQPSEVAKNFKQLNSSSKKQLAINAAGVEGLRQSAKPKKKVKKKK